MDAGSTSSRDPDPAPGTTGPGEGSRAATGSPSRGASTRATRFHVVLVEPEIPPNTGNIGRLCVAAGASLHLVGPLGFDIDDRSLKRAGLDYWPHLDLSLWPSLEDLQAAADTAARFFYLTTRAARPYWDARFQPGDHLVFGPESRGLPTPLLRRHPERCLTIPMPGAGARSLNLATSAGIVLYEALRQGS